MARWRRAKEEEGGDKDRRPYLASECNDVRKCEKWRLEIIREISKKVSQIQNGKRPSVIILGDNRLTHNLNLHFQLDWASSVYAT